MDRDRFPDGYRWQLVETFRERTNQSANISRGLLVALCTGSIFFLGSKHYEAPRYHIISIAAFIFAIATIVWSWDLQKTKSAARMTTLRDKGYDDYVALEDKYAGRWYFKNYQIDRIAYGLIVIGVLVELLPKLWSFIGT